MPRHSEAREHDAARLIHWYERGLVHVLQTRPLAQREALITNGEHRVARQFAEAMLAFERSQAGAKPAAEGLPSRPRRAVPEEEEAPAARRARRPARRRRVPKKTRSSPRGSVPTAGEATAG